MSRIVCATRGGEASRRAQERAISLAKERSAELIFLYVTDPSACGQVSAEMAETLKDELNRIGRSLLHIAHARALDQGVETKMVTRCGPVRQTIRDFVLEVRADVLVIGAPRPFAEGRVFDEEEIRPFAEELARTTGVEVVVV